MALYKYVTIDTLKRILSSGIRFTQPSAFNDPFELLPELCIPADTPEKQITLSFDTRGKRRIPPVGEVEEVADGFNCSDITSRNIINKLNECIGILCLSRNHDSLLMWSHYADRYAGAVIEFDDSCDFFDGQIDVEYRLRRPKKDISVYLRENEPVPIAELCVKSAQWEYEGEVRIIRNLEECKKIGGGNSKFSIYIQKIPHDCIRKITFGEHTSIQNQRDIWELIKETRVSLSLAAISNWGFEFRNEDIKYNVPFSEMNPWITPRTAHIFSHLPNGLGESARLILRTHSMSKFANTTV